MKKTKQRISLKDKIRDIKRGRIEPSNAQEWAIYNEHLRMQNADRIRNLHDRAAINKPNTMAGKIVCVPPKKGTDGN